MLKQIFNSALRTLINFIFAACGTVLYSILFLMVGAPEEIAIPMLALFFALTFARTFLPNQIESQ